MKNITQCCVQCDLSHSKWNIERKLEEGWFVYTMTAAGTTIVIVFQKEG
jgi:hypothetical protein